MNNLFKAIKIIRSCKTREQLEICEKWIKSVKTINSKMDYTDNRILALQLESFCLKLQTDMIKNNLR